MRRNERKFWRKPDKGIVAVLGQTLQLRLLAVVVNTAQNLEDQDQVTVQNIDQEQVVVLAPRQQRLPHPLREVVLGPE